MQQIVARYSNGEYKFTTYPRISLDEKVEGLDKVITYYAYIRADQPSYDGRLFSLKSEIEFTSEKFNDYILICTDKHTIEQLPNEVIIQHLNDDLGNYLDVNYPIWKRIKHINNLINGIDIEKITPLVNWLDDCRNERDRQEKELINNDILPTFKYPEMP